MSSELDQAIQLGNDITATRYFVVANCTILFYDYFLTLGDEAKYAWSGKKSWTFWLYFSNRYFPMSYQFWLFATSFTPNFDVQICNSSAWYSIFVFVTCTLLAQVVLTIRIYAVTKKNVRVAAGFCAVTACQLGLGIYMLILGIEEGSQSVPAMPPTYPLCVFVLHRRILVSYTSLSLLYDSLAFLLMVYLAKKSKRSGLKVVGLFRTIAQDTARYFLVIFTAHFVLVMTLTLGREGIQLLPGPGVVVYIPVMISRIMLSLRKAADSQHQKEGSE